MPGIYIHIPFCKQACHYCDFHFSVSLKNKDVFLEALIKEIELQKNYFKIPTTQYPILNTIYFGGGTPSLLSGEEIKKILNTISKHHEISRDAEITLEANPDDLTENKLESFIDAGINRLSIGIQSFSDEDLKFMNRTHDSKQAIECVKLAQDNGFSNISVDLIYGTPTLSNDQWIKNIQIVSEMNITHLSCYSLTVESKTALADMIKKGKAAPVDENKSAEQFDLLIQHSAENGFEQYEISNFARNGMYSRHNSNYWRNEKYLGLGPSAHSYNGKSRQWNVSNNAQYIESISENKIPFELEELTKAQRYNEYVLTSLRTVWGCSLTIIKSEFGEKFVEYFILNAEKSISNEWIQKNNDVYTLTTKGKLFADKIASELFLFSDKIFRQEAD